MSKFFVSSTIVALIAISGLAFTLIAIVIARSPYTHGNLSPEGYDRTEIALVGEEYPFEGLGLADPGLAQTGDPAADGRALFFQYGCTSCHGLKGGGATVGTDLSDASPSEIRREVRDGPEGMPAFVSSSLSDEDLDKIVAFLTSDATSASGAADAESLDVASFPQEDARSMLGDFLERVFALLTSARGEAWGETVAETGGAVSPLELAPTMTEER
jgi:mono/diheme cytochrome c family protein